VTPGTPGTGTYDSHRRKPHPWCRLPDADGGAGADGRNCGQAYGRKQMPASPLTPPHVELPKALSLAIHSPALVNRERG